MKWVDEVLREWAEAIRSGPTETITVTPGGRPSVVLEGGIRAWDSPPTANGRQSHRIDKGAAPQGYCVKGLIGRPAKANTIMRRLHHYDRCCAMTLRAEYGLVMGVDAEASVLEKAKHLGQYLEAKPWSPQIYHARKARALDLFEFAFLMI